jgi:hypothetical protein
MSNVNPAAKSVYGVPISEKTSRKAARTRQRFQKKYGAGDTGSYPLLARDNPALGPHIGLKEVFSGADGESIQYDKAVFIGTIRMGYGHYRIGMALASAARAKGYIPYWFDLLGFDSAGARMIRDLDKWYSLGSRISQKSKLFNRLLWDPMFGKWYKRLEKNYPIMEASTIFTDTHRAIPPETPFLGTHPWNSQGALHAGLKRVVNVVPDNCPLGFHLAPGALHTVQSPSAYFIFRTLRELGSIEPAAQGIPEDQLFLAGHYVDHELAANINEDCDARLVRMRAGAPRRFLVSIGGAGAQQELIISLIEHLMPSLRKNKAALFLNCGDHKAAFDKFSARIAGFRETAQTHFDWSETQEMIRNAGTGHAAGLHVFLNEDPFIAVYTTNMLMRVSDILVTKPSELAFYPIPKLLLERVGGHEAWGAIRSAELGDGTPECRGLAQTLQVLDLMRNENDLLAHYCEGIKRQHALGTYNGAYRAVALAAGEQPGQ